LRDNFIASKAAVGVGVAKAVRKVTIKDIASELGVSPATVSRALRDDRGIGGATRGRVKASAAALNYVPNHFGAALSTGRTHSILFVVPYSVDDVPHILHMQVLEGVAEEVSSFGYRVEIVLERTLKRRHQTVFDVVRLSHIDGAVLVVMRALEEELANLAFPIPVVVVNQVIGSLNADFVIADDRSGAFNATRHLIAAGHRDIAHVAGPLLFYSNERRRAGYAGALAAHGLPISEELIAVGDMTQDGGEDAVKTLLHQRARFTAIFCGLDIMAVGAIAALEQSGRSVPDDVSIVGFDDDVFSGMLRPALTTVRKPRHEMGREAGRLLMRRIRSGSIGAHETRVLKTKLVERASVAPPHRPQAAGTNMP
jgi:DNA-binding LacI/PurR family transcriptional regulator